MDFSRRRPLFLVFLFLVSQYFFMQSPLFHFREVKIVGSNRVAESLIKAKLGLVAEANYWNMSGDSLEVNLESLHRLANADVRFTFPGEVDVRVAERQPSFFVAYRRDANKWFSSDGTGVILEASKPSEGNLKFFLCHPVKGGMKVRPRDLQVVRFFQDSLKGDLRKQVRAINIGKNREITLKVAHGKEPLWVRLGRPERLEYKLFLLGELLAQISKEKVDVRSIDLRYSAPVVTKRTPKA
jgi:cell division septal protein FtsQ